MINNIQELHYYLSLLDRTQRAALGIDFPWLAHMIAFKTGKLREYEKHHSEIHKIPSQKILTMPLVPSSVTKSISRGAIENQWHDGIKHHFVGSGISFYAMRDLHNLKTYKVLVDRPDVDWNHMWALYWNPI